MKIVVGLGNPGPKYETTRHNAGFLALDRLADRFKAEGPLKKGEAEVFTAQVRGEKVLLVKPLTYMNLSGRAVAPLCQFYKVEPEDLIVIHDDLDLPPITMRIKTGGGSGGQKGIQSIDSSLGAGKTGYHRVRVGIGHPSKVGSRLAVVDYVLEQFSDQELKELDNLLEDVADAVELMIGGEVAKAMNRFNTSKPD